MEYPLTLQELAQIGGVVGVIASLTYAAVQIRNNTRAVRATAFQQMAGSNSSQLDELARNADLCSLMLRGGDDFEALDRLEKARFRFHMMSHLSRVENAFMQYRIGTLKDDHWTGIRNGMLASLEAPGRRAAWALVKNRLNPEFRDYVDKIVEQVAAADAAKPSPSPKGSAKHRRSRPSPKA